MNVVFVLKNKKNKNSSDILSYTDNSNEGLIYPYTFLYIIIILTYGKIYFKLYTIGKKNDYEKFNIFTCRVVLPETGFATISCAKPG